MSYTPLNRNEKEGTARPNFLIPYYLFLISY
jgi:hypothetical protein